MPKVAIVGAGSAGLGAAATLLEQGLDVVLIEAFARFGGRACTDTSQGFSFDRGPQYIQDPGPDNPWTQIAEMLDFAVQRGVINGCFRVEEDGVWTTEEMPPAGVTAFNDSLAESYEQAAEEFNAPAHLEPAAKTVDISISLASNGLGSISESAEPWQYVARDNARQVDGNNDVDFVERGVGTLVQAYGEWLVEQYPESLDVTFAKVVSRIELRADNRVALYEQNQELCTADYCIVTVPCSATSRIAFVPAFDQDRVTANGYIVLGSYKKVAFKPVAMPAAIEVDKQYYVYDDALNACWQYFRLPTSPDALIGVASGNFARRLDGMPPAEAAAAFVAAMNAAYPVLGNNPPSIVVPLGISPLVTNWTNQQHVWGAYSYTRYDGGDPACSTAYYAREIIGKPHGDGRIRFAGEATWTDAYGTLHGAYLSGRREAKVILTALGLGS